MLKLRVCSSLVVVLCALPVACGTSGSVAERIPDATEAGPPPPTPSNGGAKGDAGVPTPNDGVKNGTETDVDCGGPAAPRCDDGKTCLVASDCTSSGCRDLGAGPRCQPPSPTDGAKNGTETDVDCGGPGNPTCSVGRRCLEHADCASDGCAYDGTCAPRRSCTGHFGGDTCGRGGAGGVGAASWESCCATAPAGGVELGKYQVTSGRMREFVTRVSGNVRAFVRAKRTSGFPAGVTFPETYDLYVPNAMDGCDQDGSCAPAELTDHFYDAPSAPPNDSFQGIYTSVYRHLGGNIFNGQDLVRQGCQIASYGTHSYWMPAAKKLQYFGDPPAEQSQAEYDTKALNCVSYLMAQAFCLWDGGRLETMNEWLAAWGADNMPWGPSPTPWGPGSDTFYVHRFPNVDDTTFTPPPGFSIEYGNYNFSYEHPNLVDKDYIVFINAPGRLRGRGPNGHADIVGNLMEMTSDVTVDTEDPRTSKVNWTSNGSFEGHGWQKSVAWNFSLVNKYGMQGLRCAYP